MMHPYRKKPVEVKAIQVPQTLSDEFRAFMEYANTKTYAEGKERTIIASEFFVDADETEVKGYVQTLEGEMEFYTGDWIIEGVQGELYPCKDDIFQATYEDAGKEDEFNPIEVTLDSLAQLFASQILEVNGDMARVAMDQIDKTPAMGHLVRKHLSQLKGD